MTLRFPVAILVNSRPGYSDYNLGQQMKSFLEGSGVTVQMIDKKDKNVFGKSVGHHLVSYYTDVVWPQYELARRVRPKSIMHIQCIGPRVYPFYGYVAYLSTLAEPKINGIPTRHINVSPSTEREFGDMAREWLSPSVARNVMSRARTCCYGIEDGFRVHDDASPDSLVVPYNRWQLGQKNMNLHVQLSATYQAMCSMKNRPYGQVYYYNEDDFDPKETPPDAQAVYDFRPQFYDRASFKENIGKHGMFLSTSIRESFGLYYLELLKAGVVGVFHDYPWIRSLLPEYPYKGPSNELLPMLDWIRTNYAEARHRVLTEIVPLIEQRYSQTAYLGGLMEELVALEAMDTRKEEPA